MIKKKIKDSFEEKVIASYLKKYHYDTKSNFRKEDVFIVGYPKSGNTWMQNLIAGLLFGIDTQYLPDRLTQELVPPVKNRRFFKRFLEFACFKSHELPQKDYQKVILLIRDGRDVMPSYKSMNDKMGKIFSLEEMVKEGKGLYPCKWSDFYRRWNDNPYKSELLLVKYENLVADAVRELQRICDFLALERDENLIERVVKGNKFEEMRKKRKEYGMDNRVWDVNKEFFRAGKVGSFSKDFDTELLTFFENEAKDMLTQYNYI